MRVIFELTISHARLERETASVVGCAYVSKTVGAWIAE